MGGFAWVTLATNDSYSLGALVLAHSLKRAGTKHDLAVLITPGVTDVMREKLSSVFSLVQEVNVLDSKDEANLALLARPELGITFTKLHCWRLTQYEKCVFVDADALVVRNCDELFERQELSAAPDVGWPDCFNSGVFVFEPSQQTFASLTAFAMSKGSFDGGDQGLLNSFFSDWAHKDISKHLPFIYNMCSTATYSYLPAYKQFGEDVRIIHFIGGTKPWLQYFDTLTGQVQPAQGTGHLQPLLQHWWDIFCENVHPELSPVMASSTLAPHWHNYPLPSSLKPTSTRHVCHDATDMTYDEVDAIPDFSEFRDPWENYIQVTNDPPSIDNYQQIHHSKSNELENENKQLFTDNFYKDVDQFSQTMQNIFIANNNSNHNYATSVQSNLSTNHNHNHHHHSHQTDFSNSTVHHERDEHSFQKQNSPNHSQHFDYNEYLSNLQYQDDKHHDNHVQYTKQENHDQKVFEGFDETDQSSNQLNTINSENLGNDYCQNEKINNTIEHDHNYTDEIQSSNSIPKSNSQPCTESNFDGSHTDSHNFNKIEENAGIAGALAKITLGEMRSPEQVALEEHMRKYGWEQGKIDYMGRDSFDNIWKKISTTLEISPADTKSEKTSIEEKPASSGTKKSPTLEKTVDEITEKKTKVDEAVTEQKQDIIMESQQDKIDHETQAQPTSPTVLALKAAPSILSIKHSGEKSQRTFEYQPISKEEDDEPSTPTPGSVIPLGFTTSPTYETTTSLNLATDEQETEIPERPAPIQRALSIVEAEIKESVTEDIKPVSGEVFSSISASPEDPISAVSVGPPMPIETSIPSQPNGNTDHDYDSISSDQEETIPQSVARNSGLLRRDAPFGASSGVAPFGASSEIAPFGASSGVAPSGASSGIAPFGASSGIAPFGASSGVAPFGASSGVDAAPIERTTTSTLEKVPEIPVEESGGSVPEVLSNVPEVTAEVKLTSEQIPEVPISTGETFGAQFDTKQFSSSGTIESKIQIPEVEGKIEESEMAEQVPVKPVRTKDIKIPATPTVTEATPPTSPQFETSEDEAKPIMKVVEKTELENKPESEEQKMTKKVEKKDSEEAKKNVRTVEDPAEPGQSLEPDTSVPETPPPPPSSGIPVPPKRKTKPSTMKTPTKDK